MKITGHQYQKLSSHFTTWSRALPPQAFYLTAASLVVDADSIKASLCSYYPGPGRTVWMAHLLTDEALIVVEVEFDAEQYDREAEAQYQHGGNAPNWQIKQAWARPLTGVTSYRTRIHAVLGSDRFSIGVQLTFADDAHEPVALPAQSLRYDEEEQERSDKFMQALRASIPWLT